MDMNLNQNANHPCRGPQMQASDQKGSRAVATVIIFLFVAGGLYGLDSVPPVHEDEPWLAAPGYGFWMTGHFATGMFRGFYGMEHHYYGFMPLFPLLLGASLKCFGMGLFQARLVPLGLSALTLELTYRVGRRLMSTRHGVVALSILVFWPLARPTRWFTTGIPMVDFARYIRNDIAVAPFGLLAVLLAYPALQQRRLPGDLRSFAVGAVCGVATLGHVYGTFWLLAIFLAALWTCGWRSLRFVALSGAGLLLILSPWIVFIVSGMDDFIHQYLNYGNRFELTDLAFYVQNWSREPLRYELIGDTLPLSRTTQLWVVALVASTVLLGRRAVRSGDVGARLILVSALVIAGLFALLLQPKNYTYTAMLWPLLALIVAAGVLALWDRARGWVPRLLLVLLLTIPAVKGVRAELRSLQLVGNTTPYPLFMERVAAHLPPHSRVLAFQHYWFGLVTHVADFRTLLVTSFLTDPRYVETPMSFAAAADVMPPDIVLIDPILRSYLVQGSAPEHPFHQYVQQLQAYLRERHGVTIARIDDPTYGRIEILRLSPPERR